MSGIRREASAMTARPSTAWSCTVARTSRAREIRRELQRPDGKKTRRKSRRAALSIKKEAGHLRSPPPLINQLTLHAENLLQGVRDLDEITLRLHHRVDVLVRGRRFVDD